MQARDYAVSRQRRWLGTGEERSARCTGLFTEIGAARHAERVAAELQAGWVASGSGRIPSWRSIVAES
jgi:hypothetical protein